MSSTEFTITNWHGLHCQPMVTRQYLRRAETGALHSSILPTYIRIFLKIRNSFCDRDEKNTQRASLVMFKGPRELYNKRLFYDYWNLTKHIGTYFYYLFAEDIFIWSIVNVDRSKSIVLRCIEIALTVIPNIAFNNIFKYA